jgi:hypothetical protein
MVKMVAQAQRWRKWRVCLWKDNRVAESIVVEAESRASAKQKVVRMWHLGDAVYLTASTIQK